VILEISGMQIITPSWYCARTKPKHEHIAAANLRKRLSLEVFQPQLRTERVTRRGVLRVTEPLFPCYVFVRCVMAERLDDVRFTGGVSGIVHFGDRIPSVPDCAIEELRKCFMANEPMLVEEVLLPGDDVMVAEGAFAGMRASVIRVLPARRRVQVLLDILGRPTEVEVSRSQIVYERETLADMVPFLALPRQDMVRV
jgi:transcriptional antiterminator RfaH